MHLHLHVHALYSVIVYILLQVAFGSDFRSWCSHIPELKMEGTNGERELLGALNHVMEGIEISFYYFFFEVGAFYC